MVAFQPDISDMHECKCVEYTLALCVYFELTSNHSEAIYALYAVVRVERLYFIDVG